MVNFKGHAVYYVVQNLTSEEPPDHMMLVEVRYTPLQPQHVIRTSLLQTGNSQYLNPADSAGPLTCVLLVILPRRPGLY